MSETKFTQGPWALHWDSCLGLRHINGDDGCWEAWEIDIVRYADSRSVGQAHMWTVKNGGWPRVDNEPEALANACLMAAAPELYEALKNLAGAIGDVLPSRPDGFQQVCWDDVGGELIKALVVLKKARGES